MSSFVLGKTMPRPLTDEEKAEIKTHLSENPDTTVGKVVELFEEKFKTPITFTCINILIIETLMGR